MPIYEVILILYMKILILVLVIFSKRLCRMAGIRSTLLQRRMKLLDVRFHNRGHAIL
jgi:hypothetical protein